MSGTLAIVSQTGCSLSFFDLESGERTAHMTNLISEPHELLYDPGRDLLYLSHAYHHGNFWAHGEACHEISLIDPHEKRVVGTIDISPARGPHAMTLDETQDILWCSYEEHPTATGGVLAIDLKTRKVTKMVESSTKTHWFVATPDFKKAFTCNKTAEFISVLDLQKGKMVGRIDTPGGTEECGISLEGRYAYFPNPGTRFGVHPENPVIYVVDTATSEVVRQIPLDLGALATHITGQGQMMVGQYRFNLTGPEKGVQNMVAPGQLALYGSHEDAYKYHGAVDVGKIPLTLRSSPDGGLGFVANIHEGSVSVVDLRVMKVIRTLNVDDRIRDISNMCQGAHGMVYWPHRM